MLTLTWDECKKEIKGKNIIVWGIGRGEGLKLLSRYIPISWITAAIDIDQCLDGVSLKIYFDEEYSKQTNVLIRQPDILKMYDPEDTVLIVLSLRRSNEIIEIAEANNYIHYEAVNMELKERLRKRG